MTEPPTPARTTAQRFLESYDAMSTALAHSEAAFRNSEEHSRRLQSELETAERRIDKLDLELAKWIRYGSELAAHIDQIESIAKLASIAARREAYRPPPARENANGPDLAKLETDLGVPKFLTQGPSTEHTDGTR